MRDGIVFYRSFYDAIKELPDAELAKCFKAIMEYGLDGKEPETSGIEKTIYCLVKPQIDANNKRYQNGTKGGRPKTETEPNDNQAITENKPSDNQAITKCEPKDKDKVKDKDKDKVKDKDKESKGTTRFAPPTLEEVRKYCEEQGYSIDTDRFIDFYTAKDWMIGKNKMKDWKAAVRNWARPQRQESTANGTQRQESTANGSRRQESTAKSKNRFHNLEEHGYDYDKIVWEMMNDGGNENGSR